MARDNIESGTRALPMFHEHATMQFKVLLQYRTTKISLRISQFLLVYSGSRRRPMRCETEISARPQTSFASATKYDLL